MKIRDLLDAASPGVASLAAETPLAAALQTLLETGREVLAVHTGGRFSGLFGPRELLGCHRDGRAADLEDLTLGAAADPHPVTAELEEDVAAVLGRACTARAGRVPVLADGRPVAVLHALDLARAHLETLNEEVAHLHDYIRDLHDAPLD